MSIDVGAALRSAARLTMATSGLVLIAASFPVQVVRLVATQTQQPELAAMVNEMVPESAELPETAGPLALDLSLAAASALGLAALFASAAVFVVAFRTFVADGADGVPPTAYRRGLLRASANAFVGLVVVPLAVVLGLVAFVLPGLFLAVGLAFFLAIVAVEDENVVAAMRESWALARGQRLAVLGLLAGVFLAGFAFSVVGSVAAVQVAVVTPVGGELVVALAGAASSIFAAAALADGYAQARAAASADTGTGERGAGEGEDESAGAGKHEGDDGDGEREWKYELEDLE